METNLRQPTANKTFFFFIKKQTVLSVFNQKCYEGNMHTKRYTIHEVFEAMKTRRYNIFYLDKYLWSRTNTLKVFEAHGENIKCDVCGMEASHFRPKKDKGEEYYHLELIGKKDGRKFTRDHKSPLCISNDNSIENQIPMCSNCNSAWKSQFDSYLKEHVLAKEVDGNEYLLIIE